MTNIMTPRLRLMPMTLDVIDAAASRDYAGLGRLGVVADDDWPDAELADAFPHFRQLVVMDGPSGYGAWLALVPATGELIGSVGFIGRPDDAGVIEIGFGVRERFRRQGYCEEMTRALLDWAQSQPAVRSVTAHCDTTNVASQRVLRRLGFVQDGDADGMLAWSWGSHSVQGQPAAALPVTLAGVACDNS